MTKPLILAALLVGAAGCAEEPAQTADPIGPDAPVLDGPAEVVTEPTDDAVMDTTMMDAPPADDPALDDAAMTEGETVTDDGL